MPEANLEYSLEHYRELAPRYDKRTRLIDGIRLRTIAALDLKPGETVLDAGCGTGWCIPRLAEKVGATGRIIGFDPSPEMLAIASARPMPSSGPLVELHRASGDTARFEGLADAILFSYTHDLIRSRPSLENLFGQCRAGARIASTSTKLYAKWLVPANWYLKASHRGYITNFDGFEAPWSVLADYLDDFRVQTHSFTQHYVATGRVRAAFAAGAPQAAK